MINSEKVLKDIFSLIIMEAKHNVEFSNKLDCILTNIHEEKIEGKAIKRKKDKPLFNPYDLIEKGEDEFRKELFTLNINQLKDIISGYDLDPTKKTSRWRKEEKFIEHIIEMTTKRVNKGSAFR